MGSEGVEGARSRESWYTHLMIYPINIFIMISLSILLLLFLILQFCKTAREAQDNICKWTAVEKESSTLEKDKEDQNIISAIQSRLF